MNLTALAEAVGVLEPDPNQWDRTDTQNLLIGFPIALIIGYATLVAFMLLGWWLWCSWLGSLVGMGALGWLPLCGVVFYLAITE